MESRKLEYEQHGADDNLPSVVCRPTTNSCRPTVPQVGDDPSYRLRVLPDGTMCVELLFAKAHVCRLRQVLEKRATDADGVPTLPQHAFNGYPPRCI